MKKPLILITNDDGYQAAGIQALARAVAALGDVYVVAPDGARSGAAASISSATPVTVRPVVIPSLSGKGRGGLFYACSGTPVDCVKLALEQVVPRRPDLILSGINHGDNASISVHYSGTMGAVLEGCMKGIPSVGVSLWLPRRERYEEVPVPEDTLAAIAQLCQRVIEQGLPQDTCLNINLPPATVFRGWRVCRQARGQWTAEWLPLTEFPEQRSFQLTGQFTDLEPESPDTDFTALRAGYASIVPVTIDMTAHAALSFLKDTLIPQR